MKVYRIIEFEGTAPELAKQLARCIQGTYQPGAVKITSAAVEPRIIEDVPMIMHALALAAQTEWELPPERQPKPPHGASVVAVQEALNFISCVEGLLCIETDEGRQRYAWAAHTLEGIRETVERTGRVTDGQRSAVSNIENARGLRS